MFPQLLNSDRSQTSIPSRLGLRAGDWVIVRSKEEILSTLDEKACLDGLPFQPEMFAFCGKRMRVSKVAHKTCDTIHKTGGRWMMNAVHLEGSRCNGANHGWCQADCVFFWKESWLRREDDTPARPVPKACSEAIVVQRAVAAGQEPSDDPQWVCQTTALHDATSLLAWWDVRQYVLDVLNGNHRPMQIIKMLTYAGYRQLVEFGVGYRYLIRFFNWVGRSRGSTSYPVGEGRIPDGKATPAEILDLRPGEWVEVRSTEEIMRTVTKQGQLNRGMRYDLQEMSKYSGGRYRVQMRVDRLINEQTGKMMTMKNPCIQLEDVFCRAECTKFRLGCPRASNTYWREIWLKRVGP